MPAVPPERAAIEVLQYSTTAWLFEIAVWLKALTYEEKYFKMDKKNSEDYLPRAIDLCFNSVSGHSASEKP